MAEQKILAFNLPEEEEVYKVYCNAEDTLHELKALRNILIGWHEDTVKTKDLLGVVNTIIETATTGSPTVLLRSNM